MICHQCQGTGFVPHKAPWEPEIGEIVCMDCAGAGNEFGIPEFLLRERVPEVEKVLEKTFFEKLTEPPPPSKYRVKRRGH